MSGVAFVGGNPQTASDGFYRVRGRLAGSYQLTVSPPSGWVQTLPGGVGLQIVTAAAAQTIDNIDFGIRQVAGATARGLIFEDIDSDGVYGANDRPYVAANPAPQAPLHIDWNNNGVRDATERLIGATLDSNWTISQLAPGTYTFRTLPRGGWVQTFPANKEGITVEPIDGRWRAFIVHLYASHRRWRIIRGTANGSEVKTFASPTMTIGS